MLLKMFTKIEQKENLNSFYKGSTTLMPKPQATRCKQKTSHLQGNITRRTLNFFDPEHQTAVQNVSVTQKPESEMWSLGVKATEQQRLNMQWPRKYATHPLGLGNPFIDLLSD